MNASATCVADKCKVPTVTTWLLSVQEVLKAKAAWLHFHDATFVKWKPKHWIVNSFKFNIQEGYLHNFGVAHVWFSPHDLTVKPAPEQSYRRHAEVSKCFKVHVLWLRELSNFLLLFFKIDTSNQLLFSSGPPPIARILICDMVQIAIMAHLLSIAFHLWYFRPTLYSPPISLLNKIIQYGPMQCLCFFTVLFPLGLFITNCTQLPQLRLTLLSLFL